MESNNHINPESVQRLFVGNLDYKTSWQDLKDHFRNCGKVSFANVFRNGYGVVEFENNEDAMRAINELNDSVLDGRTIFVREDRKPRREKTGGSYPRRYDNTDVAGRQIFVGNLPFSTTWQDLKDKFRACGNVIRADINMRDGRPSGNGIVLFERAEDAEEAIAQFNNTDFGGREIQVHLDKKSFGN